MDEIVNKWKLFLEQEDKIKYQIYCDMEGVLFDLEEGIERELISLKDNGQLEENVMIQAIQVLNSGEVWQDLQTNSELKSGAQAIFDILNNPSEDEREKFWTYLPRRKDMNMLWSYIKEYNPTILTAPWKLPTGRLDAACMRGKKNWVGRFNLDPKEVIVTPDKYKYAARNHILIDDMDRYIEPWKSAGGIPIKHFSSDKTIPQLKDLLEK